jgi:hypothetical protein
MKKPSQIQGGFLMFVAIHYSSVDVGDEFHLNWKIIIKWKVINVSIYS